MARIAKALGAVDIKRLAEIGLHAVGTVPGLRLKVTEGGTKSWVLRTTIGIKRSDIGLGSYPAVSLADATARARVAIDKIRAGENPITDRQEKRTQDQWTFRVCALAYIEDHRASWKGAKHAQQWENSLATYTYPIFGDKAVRDVSIDDVLKAIRPAWTTKNETMDRVRNRIELVLFYAAAQGYMPRGFNPATWRGNLDQVLPKPSKVNKRQHFEAVPFTDAPRVVAELIGKYTQSRQPMGARCLLFAILCASRSTEARGALWSEIDLDNRVWNIPEDRMKMDRKHRVPLSDQAMQLLSELPVFVKPNGEKNDLVFPGQKGYKPLCDMTLTAVLRRMGLTATQHGFRSTLTDWVAECTEYPEEVRKMSLAHAIGDQTEEAYRRGDLFQKRRRLMQDWADYVTGTTPVASNVRPIRRVA